jgi:hypothetical protein
LSDDDNDGGLLFELDGDGDDTGFDGIFVEDSRMMVMPVSIISAVP